MVILAILTINTTLIEKSQAFFAQTVIFIFKEVVFILCQSDTLLIKSQKFRKIKEHIKLLLSGGCFFL